MKPCALVELSRVVRKLAKMIPCSRAFWRRFRLSSGEFKLRRILTANLRTGQDDVGGAALMLFLLRTSQNEIGERQKGRHGRFD